MTITITQDKNSFPLELLEICFYSLTSRSINLENTEYVDRQIPTNSNGNSAHKIL